mmetsp:Transcript_95880/g.266351  ORF Transcript_95880/g.266351 Transcript_95880/m.266351 type:complete len:270 (-) Transcript_95880:616-1425(-)
MIHRVDEPTVYLDLAPPEDLDRPMLTDPRLVITVHIRAHGNLRLLFWITEDPPDVFGVFEGIIPSDDGPTDGARLDAETLHLPLSAHKHLRRGSNEEFVLAQVDEEPVRSRVAVLQPVEDLAWRILARLAEGLREHRLEEVAALKLALGLLHHPRKLPRRQLSAPDAIGHLCASLEGHLVALTSKALRAAHAVLALEHKVIAHTPGLVRLGVDHQEIVWYEEHKVALLRVALLVQLDLLELEGKVVAKRTVEAQVLVIIRGKEPHQQAD